MTIIKNIEDYDYLIVDSILLIISEVKGIKTSGNLRYELLKCSIFIQHPLLNEALDYMKKNNLIKSNL